MIAALTDEDAAEVGAILLDGIKTRLARGQHPSPSLVAFAQRLSKSGQPSGRRGQSAGGGESTRHDGDAYLLSVSDAASVLALSESTVWRRVRAGRLPSVKEGGRRMVRRADLIRYLADLESS